MNLDDLLIQAYTKLNSSRSVSSEDITCDPGYRHPFLELVHSQLPEVPEAMALRRLSYLRKRSRLPRLRRGNGASNRGDILRNRGGEL